MEPVLLDLLDLHRLEGAVAHVQGDGRRLDPPLRQPSHQFRREVQAGGGRGRRPGLAREDRLVAVAVGRRVRALDVGGQGDVALRRQRRLEVALDPHAPDRIAVGALFQGAEYTPIEIDSLPRTQPLVGAHQRFMEPGTQLSEEENLDATAGCASPEEARALYLGVVDDQQIARLEQLRKVGNPLVAQVFPHIQQLRAVAGRNRLQSDALGRKIEGKGVYLHLLMRETGLF